MAERPFTEQTLASCQLKPSPRLGSFCLSQSVQAPVTHADRRTGGLAPSIGKDQISGVKQH